MTIEEFNIRLEQLENHLVAALQLFENDTGVKVEIATIELDGDNFYNVSAVLDFVNARKTE
jgi:hypothetical protein